MARAKEDFRRVFIPLGYAKCEWDGKVRTRGKEKNMMSCSNVVCGRRKMEDLNRKFRIQSEVRPWNYKLMKYLDILDSLNWQKQKFSKVKHWCEWGGYLRGSETSYEIVQTFSWLLSMLDLKHNLCEVSIYSRFVSIPKKKSSNKFTEFSPCSIHFPTNFLLLASPCSKMRGKCCISPVVARKGWMKSTTLSCEFQFRVWGDRDQSDKLNALEHQSEDKIVISQTPTCGQVLKKSFCWINCKRQTEKIHLQCIVSSIKSYSVCCRIIKNYDVLIVHAEWKYLFILWYYAGKILK